MRLKPKRGKYRYFAVIMPAVLILCMLTACGRSKQDTVVQDSDNTVSDSAAVTGNDTNADGNTDQDARAGQDDTDSADSKADTDDQAGQDSTNDAGSNVNQDGQDGTNGADSKANQDDQTGKGDNQNDAQAELIRLYALTLDNMKPIDKPEIPADSSEYSAVLASQALSMCSQGTKPNLPH